MIPKKGQGERLKLCWKATFRQPKGALNPLGLRLSMDIEVEVRTCAGMWRAFRPGTKDELPIASQPSALVLKRQVAELLFETTVVPWAPYDMVSMKRLEVGEFYIDECERAWRAKK